MKSDLCDECRSQDVLDMRPCPMCLSLYCRKCYFTRHYCAYLAMENAIAKMEKAREQP